MIASNAVKLIDYGDNGIRLRLEDQGLLLYSVEFEAEDAIALTRQLLVALDEVSKHELERVTARLKDLSR